MLPRLQVGTTPTPAETLAVVASPNVFIAASAQAAAPSPIAPSDSDNTAINWSTSDQNIALVNEFGMVVGRAPGNAVVGSELDGRWAFTAVKVVPPASPSIRIIAHRGFMRRFPENTLVAVKGAFDNGADAVEVDIRLSADGVPVVMHDATVDRTTDGRGAVNALTAAQLSTLNACAHAAGGSPPCIVPRMTDVLREAHGRGGVLLHLYGNYSTNDLEQMLAAVRAADMDRDALFICFDYPVLTYLRQLDPVVALGYLTDRPPAAKLIDALGRSAPIIELQAAIADSTAIRQYLLTASQKQQEVAVWVAWNQVQAQQAAALGFRNIVADVPIDRTTLRP